MDYALIALGGVVAALAGILLYRLLRKNQGTSAITDAPKHLTPQAQLRKLQESDIFWGVSVESHCRASSRLAGRQFPFDAVPRLPVENCESEACICRYIGLPERRVRGDRRRGQDRRGALRMEGYERRADRPRRKDDGLNWGTYRHL